MDISSYQISNIEKLTLDQKASKILEILKYDSHLWKSISEQALENQLIEIKNGFEEMSNQLKQAMEKIGDMETEQSEIHSSIIDIQQELEKND